MVWGWVDDNIISPVQSGWNWLDDSSVNQAIEGVGSRFYDRSGLDSIIDPWINLNNNLSTPTVLAAQGFDALLGDRIDNAIDDLKYVFTGNDPNAPHWSVGARTPEQEFGYINPNDPRFMPKPAEQTIPDEEDFEDDTGSGVGDLYARLAEMQRAEARRGAEAATAFVDDEYARLLSDYARWEADRQATTGTQGEINKARLDESLEYIGVNTSEALSTLADIGIDAEESARAVGGEIGASLYGIYNSGAQLIDNLDRIAADTLDEQRSASASDYASGLFQIKENLANQLAEIDQGMMMYQIQAAEAAAAAEQAVRESEQQAQMMMDYASILAEASSRRGGQMQDPFEIFATIMLGDWKPEYTFPTASSDDFNYRGFTKDDLSFFPQYNNAMDQETVDELIDDLIELGYGSVPTGFTP